MADPLSYLQQRSREQWLLTEGSQCLGDVAERRLQELRLVTTGTPPTILLTESDPVKFLASFIAACATRCPVFLGNPQWIEAEWQQAIEIAKPDLTWGDRPSCYQKTGCSVASVQHPAQPGWIMIPTGGSSGKIRFVIHTWDTLMAAVQGFRQYFQLEQVNACCVLPLYHVSGLMQFLRSFTSGGQLAILPFKSLEAGCQPALDPTTYFLSLVPTQLQRLLQNPELTLWLQQFPTILLGGAPAWTALLEQARQQQLRLALTYGMTEAASQVATLKPEAFLQGRNTCGQVLPHLKLSIADPAAQQADNPIGKVMIRGSAIALGYYADRHFDGQFQPDDLGFFDDQGELNIVGRDSRKIITGGENVFPLEVEAAIRSTDLVEDVCVIGIPDAVWGEVVTALYVPNSASVDAIKLRTALTTKLSKFKQPKHLIAIAQLPRNAQGKLNYQQVQKMAIAALYPQPSSADD